MQKQRYGELVHRSGHPLLLIATLALAALLIVPTAAHSAIEIATEDPTDIVTLGHDCLEGQADDYGVMYRACETYISRAKADGSPLPPIFVPLGGIPIKDVAPSPNGDYLYIARGPYPPARLQRQADETYRHDDKFQLNTFFMWKTWFHPTGWLITTDAAGDLYVSGGSYWSGSAFGGAQTSVIKYSPDGSVLDVIGDLVSKDTTISPEGRFRSNQDIEVSRNGDRLYVSENCGLQCLFEQPGYVPSRIQRFDLATTGRYQFDSVISAPSGSCATAGAIHSGYGMAMDIRGHLFVNSVSCGATMEFNELGQPLGRVASARALDEKGILVAVRSHWLSVDWRGTLCQIEWNACISKANPPAIPDALAPYSGPRADTIAPTITFSQLILGATPEVALDAVDERSPVTHMQIRDSSGWNEWIPFATKSPLTGVAVSERTLEARVRDSAGNVSPIATVTEVPQSPPSAPVVPVQPAAALPTPPAQGKVRDIVAPILKSASVSLVGSSRTRARLKIVATDNQRVARVRISAPGFAASRRWIPYSAVQKLKLKRVPGRGILVTVQVADEAGNRSKARTIRLRPR